MADPANDSVELIDPDAIVIGLPGSRAVFPQRPGTRRPFDPELDEPVLAD